MPLMVRTVCVANVDVRTLTVCLVDPSIRINIYSSQFDTTSVRQTLEPLTYSGADSRVHRITPFPEAQYGTSKSLCVITTRIF